MEDLAEGFGPLHSAYNAKDMAVLLQLSMAVPVVWSHLSATRSLAFRLLTEGPEMGWSQWQSGEARHHKVLVLQLEPGWESLWVQLKPPHVFVDLRSLPLEPLESDRSDGPGCFQGHSLRSFLQTHAQRVREILTAPHTGTAQAVWELSREVTRLSQSLVLFTMCPYLLENSAAPIQLAEPPMFRNACCERYRILSWLLTELWQDLGSPTSLAYVEVGVADGSTALFLLERLPWLHAYLVENQPRPELLQALPAFAGRVALFEMDSQEAAEQMLVAQSHVDAIFVDADHSFHAVASDLDVFGQLGATLVMGHDFSWEHPGVVQAVLQRSRTLGCPLLLAPDHIFFWRSHLGNSSDSKITCQLVGKKAVVAMWLTRIDVRSVRCGIGMFCSQPKSYAPS
eukprot:Skav222121  [mRNA]  locus=scaffold1181:566761:567954:- [translate_table: standard]